MLLPGNRRGGHLLFRGSRERAWESAFCVEMFIPTSAHSLILLIALCPQCSGLRFYVIRELVVFFCGRRGGQWSEGYRGWRTELENLRKIRRVWVGGCWSYLRVWMCLTKWPFSSGLKICLESFLVNDYDQYLSNVALSNMICMDAGKRSCWDRLSVSVIQKVGYYLCCIKSRNVFFCTSLPI